ncbi:MAG: hypothetical protein HY717_05905 [Planctomycetes bacterium]|nr:hypothetical protein [Planctomycetota bacterium]
MKTNPIKAIWLAVLALVVAGAGAYLYLDRGLPEHHPCELCERPIHHETAFSLVVGGKEAWACCARCGLSLCRSGGGQVAAAIATDYPSGRRVNAERCVFVEGSDLAPCCSPNAIVVGEKTPCGKCFDRCYPSVIAFLNPKEALAFSREHGGRMVSFETLVREFKTP